MRSRIIRVALQVYSTRHFRRDEGLRIRNTLALAALLCVMIDPALGAEPPAPSVQTLLESSLSGDPGKQVIVSAAVFPPGTSTGRHIHPGDEYATVLEGELEIQVDGQPVQRIKAGESYHNARDVVHETRSVGKVAARLISTFVIDKGRPLMEPVTDPAE